MVRKFKVLYTHQILKKRKVWQDGLLTLSLDEKHGILYDDEKKRLSTVYLRKTEVNSGDDLECDKYLIQVEEESSDGAISNQSTQYSQSQTLVPTFSSNLSIGKFCSQSADVSRTKVLKQFHIPRRKEVLPTSVPEQSKAISCRFSKEIEPVENTASSIWTNVLNDTKERSGVQLAATKPNIVSSPPSLRSTEDLLLFLNNGKVQNSATSQTAVKRRKFVHDLELNHKIPALSEAKEKSTSLIDEKLEPLVTESNEFHLLKSWCPPRIQHTDNYDIGTASDQNSDFVIAAERSETLAHKNFQSCFGKQLMFPSQEDLELFEAHFSVQIPTVFTSVEEYIDTWVKAIYEKLNIKLWNKSKLYHSLMAKADISNYLRQTSDDIEIPLESFSMPDITNVAPDEDEILSSTPPYCDHNAPCKVARVRKEGPNKGRVFYTCARRKFKCKVFHWADMVKQHVKFSSTTSQCNVISNLVKINNDRALTSYLKRNEINFFIDCELTRRTIDQEKNWKESKILKKAMHLKVSRQEKLLMNTRDDLWVISKTLKFANESTIVVKILSNGISPTQELVVQPLSGYSPAEWNSGDKVLALCVCKAAKELSYLYNLNNEISVSPLISHLLKGESVSKYPAELNLSTIFNLKKAENTGSISHKSILQITTDYDETLALVDEMAKKYKLNDDQTTALCTVADVVKGKSNVPILIDGVVGSGKTFLLSVIIIFLHQLVSRPNKQGTDEEKDPNLGGHKRRVSLKWKVMVCAATDAGVDDVLRCLVGLEFNHVVRVGHLNKVACSMLPYSLPHRGGRDEHAKMLKDMLHHCDQSDPERHYIMKSLDQVQCGATGRLLHNAFVVGTTCKDSLLPSIRYYKFPIIIMDNAEAISEPLAVLPLGRFTCEKMLLAGDSTTEALSSDTGPSERTLFHRLQNAGHESVILTTQYRFPSIVTSVINSVFYDETIRNGLSDSDRPRLVEGLPNLCFYDVTGVEESSGPNDFFNCEEATLIADLIKLLLSHGIPGTGIAVMTTHNAQIKEIKSALQKIDLHDLSDVACVQVTRFERYNGGEKDVVITSCVRTSGVAELDNDRIILNMLTRAKNHVIIVANLRNLSSNEKWRNIINQSKRWAESVQNSFQFRSFVQKQMSLHGHDAEVPFYVKTLESDACDEILSNKDVINSLQEGNLPKEESDGALSQHNDALRSKDMSQSHSEDEQNVSPCQDEDSDGDMSDIPLLRHKRKRTLFMLDDSDSEFPELV